MHSLNAMLLIRVGFIFLLEEKYKAWKSFSGRILQRGSCQREVCPTMLCLDLIIKTEPSLSDQYWAALSLRNLAEASLIVNQSLLLLFFLFATAGLLISELCVSTCFVSAASSVVTFLQVLLVLLTSDLHLNNTNTAAAAHSWPKSPHLHSLSLVLVLVKGSQQTENMTHTEWEEEKYALCGLVILLHICIASMKGSSRTSLLLHTNLASFF